MALRKDTPELNMFLNWAAQLRGNQLDVNSIADSLEEFERDPEFIFPTQIRDYVPGIDRQNLGGIFPKFMYKGILESLEVV